MHDLIIVGAGPAGLTAALYAGRSRLNTLVIEKMAVGGRILLSETIENYPGFPGGIATAELMQRMHEQVKELGLEFLNDEVSGIDCRSKRIEASSGSYCAKAVIIATGALPRKLNVPGEEKYTGRGVSYCATCDAPFYKNKRVVIVGGGNAVAEEALYLARFASSVSIIHRRQQLRASAILQEKLSREKKINFILNSVVYEIKGTDKVDALLVKDVISGSQKELSCDGVFIYIGFQPDTAFLRNKLQLDESGFIITGDDLSASCEGIFACGDCRKKTLYQVINACGDGAVAAESAYKYIASKEK